MWKELCGQKDEELDAKNQQIRRLQYDLAECKEKLSATQTNSTNAQQNEIAKLQQSLKEKEDELTKLRQSDKTLQGTLGKLEKIHKELQDERQASAELRKKFQHKEQTIQQGAASRVQDLRSTARETKLQAQIKKLNDEVDTLKIERSKLTERISNLNRQLQAEKEANLKQMPGMATAAGKMDVDYDDDEVLPDKLAKKQPSNSTASGSSPATPNTPRSASRPTFAQSISNKTPTSKGPATPTKSAKRVSLNLPIRDQQQQKASTPQKSSPASTETPDKKRKKREELDEEELDEEVRGLEMDLIDVPTTPRKRSKVATDDSANADFEFQAVTKHLENGGFEWLDSKLDLHTNDCRSHEGRTCPALWDRIDKVVAKWDEKLGGAWKEIIEEYKASDARFCITRKAKKSKTRWQRGEAGKYACKDCVKCAMPCFTWNGEEFLLLPLYATDRKNPVTPEEDIRHWLNDEDEMEDDDSDSDGDYDGKCDGDDSD